MLSKDEVRRIAANVFLNELVARHIVKLSQNSLHDPTELYMLTVQEFKNKTPSLRMV
jgi:hypothetical protein